MPVLRENLPSITLASLSLHLLTLQLWELCNPRCVEKPLIIIARSRQKPRTLSTSTLGPLPSCFGRLHRDMYGFSLVGGPSASFMIL